LAVLAALELVAHVQASETSANVGPPDGGAGGVMIRL
jgi:hypothetical protein